MLLPSMHDRLYFGLHAQRFALQCFHFILLKRLQSTWTVGAASTPGSFSSAEKRAWQALSAHASRSTVKYSVMYVGYCLSVVGGVYF